MFSFDIPGRLPGLNELVEANRVHRMVGAKLKKEADNICAQWILVGRVPVFTGPLWVHFDWFVADGRDPDNIRTGAKFILDALVKCGKLPNDGQKIIFGFSDTFSVDKVNPRVKVSFEEAI